MRAEDLPRAVQKMQSGAPGPGICHNFFGQGAGHCHAFPAWARGWSGGRGWAFAELTAMHNGKLAVKVATPSTPPPPPPPPPPLAASSE